MTASLSKADGSLSPVGELASYSLTHTTTPLDPRDSSGQIPTFSAVVTGVQEDAKGLAGQRVQLEDWTGSVTQGRVTAVSTSSGSGAVGLDASTIFERLNTTQTTLPLIFNEVLSVDPVAEALKHWMLMCGIPSQRLEGNLLHYIADSYGYANYGYIADSISKWRMYGPPEAWTRYVPSAGGETVSPIEVNPAQSVIIGGAFHKDYTLSEVIINAQTGATNTRVYYTLRRNGSTWTLREKVSGVAESVLMTKTYTPSQLDAIMYAFVLVKANAVTGKVDLTMRLMEYNYLTGDPVYSDTTVTGVTSTLRNRPRPTSIDIGYDDLLTATHTSYGSPDAYFLLESKSLQATWPDSLQWINTHENILSDEFKQSMPFKIPGFTGNVYEKMRELCALLDLDLFFEKGRIRVYPRSGRRETLYDHDFIQALDIGKSSVTEKVNDREIARSVEVLYREMLGTDSSYTNTLLWNSDSVYTLEKGETKEELIQTDSSFVFLHQPICVSGVPVPYTSGFSSYVITGHDGFIVDPQWWVDNGGSITAHVTENSGEIRLVMQAPNVDTVRAPYRVSEGAADRPALYVKGYGMRLSEPKVLKSYTGAQDAAQDVGARFDSIFITKKLMAQNTAHKLASVYGTAASGITAIISQADLGAPVDSNAPLTPLGDSIYWKGSYYRIRDESIAPGSISIGTADRFNTVRVLNGEFATGKTIADWNSLHAGKTIREVTAAPLPKYEG